MNTVMVHHGWTFIESVAYVHAGIAFGVIHDNYHGEE